MNTITQPNMCFFCTSFCCRRWVEGCQLIEPCLGPVCAPSYISPQSEVWHGWVLLCCWLG